MRETGWSLSVAGVRHLRGVAPSKILLLRTLNRYMRSSPDHFSGLRRVICDDNLANNGGILAVLVR